MTEQSENLAAGRADPGADRGERSFPAPDPHPQQPDS